MKKNFKVTGMSCASCQAHVQKAVSRLDGVREANVNLLTGSMSVDYDEKRVNASGITRAVSDAGYGAELQNDEGELSGDDAESESLFLKRRIIFSLVFFIPLLYLAMYAMFHLPVPAYISDTANSAVYALIQLALLVPVVWFNRRYFTGGFVSLYRRSPNMDSLVATGAGAGILYGVIVIFRMLALVSPADDALLLSLRGDLYFEAAGMILILVTFGKYLESSARLRTTSAISYLISLALKISLVERGGRTLEIPVPSLKAGDIVVVKAGSTIPADGVVVEGGASVDQAAVTGESVPVDKTVNDKVTSGTLCAEGFFKFRAEKVGRDSTLSRIISLVEEASASKAPMARLADKVSSVFVPIVMGIALLSFIVWLISGSGLSFALSVGIAVLVISCPCALGLATPVAVMVGTGRGAESGILFRDAVALETLRKVDTVILDKTGTVTNGKPFVTDVIPSDGVETSELLSFALSLESFSSHPLAVSVAEYSRRNGGVKIDGSNFTMTPGRGVSAELSGGYGMSFAGNLLLTRELKLASPELEKKASHLADEGRTVLFFMTRTRLLGMIALADLPKGSSRRAVEDFRSHGLKVVMLTGDNAKTAHAVAEMVGIDEVVADVLPQDKERIVREYRESAHVVAMIGDGINDAPALTRADVGVAIGGGSDIAVESSGVILMKNSLSDAVTAYRLSRAVVSNIKLNLFWAFLYNVLAIPLAAGVFYPEFGLKLNPMIGAFAMSMSSVCVVLNALRLKRFR